MATAYLPRTPRVCRKCRFNRVLGTSELCLVCIYKEEEVV